MSRASAWDMLGLAFARRSRAVRGWDRVCSVRCAGLVWFRPCTAGGGPCGDETVCIPCDARDIRGFAPARHVVLLCGCGTACAPCQKRGACVVLLLRSGMLARQSTLSLTSTNFTKGAKYHYSKLGAIPSD